MEYAHEIIRQTTSLQQTEHMKPKSNATVIVFEGITRFYVKVTCMRYDSSD
jgi:hypothetical protein